MANLRVYFVFSVICLIEFYLKRELGWGEELSKGNISVFIRCVLIFVLSSSNLHSVLSVVCALLILSVILLV